MIDINDAWYRVSVKALIYNQKWQILLCKEEWKWIWDLPWGWLDHGEDQFICLEREIREEMWLEVLHINHTPKCFVTAYKSLSKTRPWIGNICYEVKVKNLDFIPSQECIEIWFFDFEGIQNINVLPNVSEVFKKIF